MELPLDMVSISAFICRTMNSLKLQWKTLNEKRVLFVASLMYKITHDLAPKRLSDIFHQKPPSRRCNLTGSSTELYLPQPKTDYRRKSRSYGRAKQWNTLSDDYVKRNHVLPLKPAFQHLAKSFGLFNLFNDSL